MAGDEKDKPQDPGNKAPSLQEIIAAQKAKLQRKLKDRGESPSAKKSSGSAAPKPAPAAAKPKPKPAPATAPKPAPAPPKPAPAAPPETEVEPSAASQARIDAAMEARADGADKEAARQAGEEAAPRKWGELKGEAPVNPPADEPAPEAPAPDQAEPSGPSDQAPAEPPEVAQARIDAVMEARSNGASREEARAAGDVAAAKMLDILAGGGVEADASPSPAPPEAPSADGSQASSSPQQQADSPQAHEAAGDDEARRAGRPTRGSGGAPAEPATVVQARIDAIMEARAKGASKEEAKALGEAAAEAARQKLIAEAEAEAAAEAAPKGPIGPPDEHPEAAAARKEAYEEAIARGATDEEAQRDGEAAAQMILADLEYQEQRRLEAEEEARRKAEEEAARDAAGGEAASEDVRTPVAGATPEAGAVVYAGPAKRSLVLQLVLVMNTGLIGLLLAGFLGFLPGRAGAPVTPASVAARDENAGKIKTSTVVDLEKPIGVAAGTVSEREAAAALGDQKYAKALERYRQLLSSIEVRGGDLLLADLFRFRIAQCLRQLGKARDARMVYERAARSNSPVVAASAEFDMALMDERDELFLQARLRAYRAIAALGAMQRATPLEAECDFLIARVLTKKVRKFYQAGALVPWPEVPEVDLFTGQDEQQIRQILRDGSGSVQAAGMDATVQIKPAASVTGTRRWSVLCSHIPMEDVLNQFASKESGDLAWQGVQPEARQRTVSLRMRSVPWRRFNEVACGMAGLLARFAVDRVTVHDPLGHTVMSEQRDLLARECENAWRRLFLHESDQERIATGRFAVAALGELAGDAANALREYQLVSGRYPRSAVAPQALIRCASIRFEKLRDYRGARQDINHLMNGWPQFTRSPEANLLLARAAMKSGLIDEALRGFRKLYHMRLSAESVKQGCLGAGECYYRKGDYRAAAEKLQEYIQLAGEASRQDLARAYMVLGEALAQCEEFDSAVGALERALAWGAAEEQTAEAALALGRIHLERQNFLSALGALGALKNRTLGSNQARDYLLLTSRTYREMGLAGQAQQVLGDEKKLAAITDAEGRAQILVELARGSVAAGDLAGARKHLLNALPGLQPGRIAWEASLELAEVALQLGNAAEAISIARELTQARCPSPIRGRAQEILVGAYVKQQDYRSAASALGNLGAKTTGASK